MGLKYLFTGLTILMILILVYYFNQINNFYSINYLFFDGININLSTIFHFYISINF